MSNTALFADYFRALRDAARPGDAREESFWFLALFGGCDGDNGGGTRLSRPTRDARYG